MRLFEKTVFCIHISKIICNNTQILDFIYEAFEALDNFIFRDKKYVINKQLFKLYWCLEAIKIFARIIEDCKDSKIRNHSIFGIVQYLSFRGRYDEAKKYLELYPNNEYSSKDELMDYCLVGEEKIIHHQKMLDKFIFKILNNLGTSSIESIEAFFIIFSRGMF